MASLQAKMMPHQKITQVGSPLSLVVMGGDYVPEVVGSNPYNEHWMVIFHICLRNCDLGK